MKIIDNIVYVFFCAYTNKKNDMDLTIYSTKKGLLGIYGGLAFSYSNYFAFKISSSYSSYMRSIENNFILIAMWLVIPSAVTIITSIFFSKRYTDESLLKIYDSHKEKMSTALAIFIVFMLFVFTVASFVVFSLKTATM